MNEIFNGVMRVAHATADRSPSRMPAPQAEGGIGIDADRGRAFMPLGIRVFFSLFLRVFPPLSLLSCR